MAESNKMLIDATHPEETRVVVLRGGRVEEFDYESAARKQLRGNIYLAKVTRVEPSLQAAFVEYGGNRHGFLAFNEIHPDYYQIPVADRIALIEEEAAAEAAEEAAAEARAEARAKREAAREAARQNRGHATRGGSAAESADSDVGDDDDDEDDDVSEIATIDNAEGPGGAYEEGDDDDHGADHDEPPVQRAEATGLADDRINAEPTAGDDDAPCACGDDHADPDAAHKHEHGHGHSHDDTHHDTHGEAVEGARAVAAEAHEEIGDEAHAGDQSDTADHPGEGNEATASADAGDEPKALADNGSEGRADRDGNGNGNGKQSREPDESVEQVGAEDALEELPSRPRRRPRNYKIQEVIKRRQVILVQVVKEERGNKGAALTTYLSLAGRYTVLMPNTARGGGISRKITQPQDRKRLKAIAAELEVPEGMGLIIRTAGAARTKQEIKRDFEYLLRLWESVRDLTLQSTAPSLVYEEGNLIKRSIRDLYNKDVEEVIVAGDEAFQEARDFMRMLMPSHAKNVIHYQAPEPLFTRYQIERQLNAMFSPYVTLKSGGYLVINQTEALVAVDVNSGKSTREFSIEETALNTNLEAADEIARQLKLRDLAGLIVVDFIDMEEKRNNRAVERRLKEALRFDRARIQVGRISHFGLMEMSRQRLRTGVLEGSTSQCPHCQGTGIIRSVESVALAVLRGLEDAVMAGARTSLVAVTTPTVALYILNKKRVFITDMEARLGLPIMVEGSDKMQGANFAIEKGTGPASVQSRPQRTAVNMDWGFGDDEADAAEDADEELAVRDERTGRSDSAPVQESEGEGNGDGRRRRRRRRRGRRDRERNGELVAGDADESQGGRDAYDDDDGDADDDIESNGAEVAARSNESRDDEARSTSEGSDEDDDADGAESTSAAGEGGGEGGEAGGEAARRRRRRGRRGGRRNRDRQDRGDEAVRAEGDAAAGVAEADAGNDGRGQDDGATDDMKMSSVANDAAADEAPEAQEPAAEAAPEIKQTAAPEAETAAEREASTAQPDAAEPSVEAEAPVAAAKAPEKVAKAEPQAVVEAATEEPDQLESSPPVAVTEEAPRRQRGEPVSSAPRIEHVVISSERGEASAEGEPQQARKGWWQRRFGA